MHWENMKTIKKRWWNIQMKFWINWTSTTSKLFFTYNCGYFKLLCWWLVGGIYGFTASHNYCLYLVCLSLGIPCLLIFNIWMSSWNIVKITKLLLRNLQYLLDPVCGKYTQKTTIIVFGKGILLQFREQLESINIALKEH